MPQTEREQQERTVTFMVDPEAQFVSLVDRAANQTPWRIVKSQGDPNMSVKVVHSIIAPAGVAKDDILAVFGDEMKDVLKFDKPVERGGTVSYEQAPRKVFKAETLELAVLDKDKGIRCLQGEVEKNAQGSFITRLFKSEEPKAELVAAEGLVLEDGEVMKNAYSDGVAMELFKFMDGVAAILSQEKGDPAVKMASINAMSGNLLEYVNEALSVTKGEALSIKKAEAPAGEQPVEDPGVRKEEGTEDQPAGEPAAEPASEEPAGEPAAEEPAAEEPAAEPQEVQKSQAELLAEAVTAALAPVQESLKSLAEKVAATDAAVTTMKSALPVKVQDRTADDVTEDPAQKAPVKKADKDVFAGCLGLGH